jgi:plastocyanin
MRVRKRSFLAVAGVLGAAVAVLPALAGSETTPTIDAVNVPAGVYSEEHHYWQPAAATVAPGGSVTFRNASEVPHGVEWRSALKPSCEEGAGKVPVGTTSAASGTKWSGSCTFSQPGSYSFYCTVHGKAMSGTINVEVPGTATGTTTTGAQPPPGASTTTTATTTAPQLLAVASIRALKLAPRHHGGTVHGSLLVSPAGAGGRLEVDLLAARASLAAVGHGPARIRVGRLVRSSLRAGSVSFAVRLDRRARRALRRHGRLALTVKVVLTPLSGAPFSLTAHLAMHA